MSSGVCVAYAAVHVRSREFEEGAHQTNASVLAVAATVTGMHFTPRLLIVYDLFGVVGHKVDPLLERKHSRGQGEEFCVGIIDLFDTTMCAAPDLPVLSRPCEWGGWWRSILKGAFPECGQAFVDVMRSVLELWIHFEGILPGLPWFDSTVQSAQRSPDSGDERLHVGLVQKEFHLCVDACMRLCCQKRCAFAASATPLTKVRFI